MTAPAFRPGDRVISTTWSKKLGELGKVSKVTAMVKWDGEERFERVYLESLRPETAADVAIREHEAAMKAWRDMRPKTVLAKPGYQRTIWGHQEWDAVDAERLKTPAEMRQAADEMRLLADWFETKPKETP